MDVYKECDERTYAEMLALPDSESFPSFGNDEVNPDDISSDNEIIKSRTISRASKCRIISSISKSTEYNINVNYNHNYCVTTKNEDSINISIVLENLIQYIKNQSLNTR